jgi:hypothetical protein
MIMMDYSKITITVTDCRRCGHCARGIKSWFESYGLDFRDFIKNGIPANKFLATNDAYATGIVEAKLKREGL